MNSIKDIVMQVVGDLSVRKPETQTKIQRIWKSVLDEREAMHTQIIELKEGMLVVHVDSPAWLYQMNFKKKKILEKIQEEHPVIENIFFKVGSIK